MFYRRPLANAIRVLSLIFLGVCFGQNSQAQTAKTVPVRTHPAGLARRTARIQQRIINNNEAGAILSLQKLFSAEATYQSTTGNGDYGTLEELRKQGLIDQVLGEGHRYGYLFRITAVPRGYGRTGRRSFYVNETGVTYADDKKGSEATHADHALVIDP